jgi:hypothetical protein
MDVVRFCLEHRGAVEEKSGIGGSMVRRTRKKATRTGRQAACAESGEGRAEVNQAAEAALTVESARVVAQLTERAFHGRNAGVPCLVDLPDTVPDQSEPATDQDGISLAVAWMSEPEWNGESSEGISEISAGNREPEHGMD